MPNDSDKTAGSDCPSMHCCAFFPIDTAPKDGTHILAYDVMSYGWKLAFFERIEGQWYGDAPTKLGNPLGNYRLTHWIAMLPDPLIQHNNAARASAAILKMTEKVSNG